MHLDLGRFKRGPGAFGQKKEPGKRPTMAVRGVLASKIPKDSFSIWLWRSKPFWDQPFWGIGEFTTHFSGDWDVHWGYDLDFDPWPFR